MTVLVIGGGASGMAAALTAAEAGHRVLLAERQSRVGRKLLATGNGRCNLSNLHASPAHYHGAAVDFCRPALERFPSEETAAEPSGRVYPVSNMAGSVLDVLRYALERPEIELRTGCVITQLHHRGGAFTARMENGETLTAERVILAAGGAAGSRVGGVMDGYQLAKQLGHHRTALLPSLVQMKTDPTYPRGLKGVKAEADVRVLRGREVLAQGRGEILFTEYGVSGMVKERRRAGEDRTRRLNTVAAMFCILAALPLFAAVFWGVDAAYILGVCLTIVLAGVGAALFVYTGTETAAMEKLLEDGDYTRARKRGSSLRGAVSVIYWLTATAVFLFYTFGPRGNGQPQYSWFIWAIAGVLYAAVMAIVRLLEGRKR